LESKLIAGGIVKKKDESYSLVDTAKKNELLKAMIKEARKA